MNKTFTQDVRENGALHMNYVKTAVEHLTWIDNAIAQVYSFSNWEMHGTAAALQTERKRLVDTNSAYHDADEIVAKRHEVVGMFRRRKHKFDQARQAAYAQESDVVAYVTDAILDAACAPLAKKKVAVEKPMTAQKKRGLAARKKLRR